MLRSETVEFDLLDCNFNWSVLIMPLQGRSVWTTVSSTLRDDADNMVETDTPHGHRQRSDSLPVPPVQDEHATRSLVNDWPLDQLRAHHPYQFRLCRRALDQTWHCPTMPAWWLNYALNVVFHLCRLSMAPFRFFVNIGHIIDENPARITISPVSYRAILTVS